MEVSGGMGACIMGSWGGIFSPCELGLVHLHHGLWTEVVKSFDGTVGYYVFNDMHLESLSFLGIFVGFNTLELNEFNAVRIFVLLKI